MNKKLLAAAIAGLVVSGNAGAIVIGTDQPRVYARELVKPADLTADADDDIQVRIKYNFSNGEVRYGSLQCTNTQLTPVGVPVVAGDSNADGTGSDLVLGAVNGVGTNTLYFSITDAGSAAKPTQNDTISFEVNTILGSNLGSDCTFGIFDSPSQAQAGVTNGTNTPGLIGQSLSTGAYMRTADSFTFSTTKGTTVESEVETTAGAYFSFVGGANTAQLGTVRFDYLPLTGYTAQARPYDYDGTLITLQDIFDVTAGTNYDATSPNFSFPTGHRLDFSCANYLFTYNATVQTYVIDETQVALPHVNVPVCYDATGTSEIPEGLVRIKLDPVVNSGYVVSNHADAANLFSYKDLGEIARNGTRLQAPLAQLPGGYLSRIAITNTGAVARNFTISVLGETGNVISTANTIGSVAAGSLKVIDLNTVLTGFSSGSPRATILLTVAAPNKEIQGLYQIVKPDTGAISNHVMVRPGTN